jgi:hypothetical protein
MAPADVKTGENAATDDKAAPIEATEVDSKSERLIQSILEYDPDEAETLAELLAPETISFYSMVYLSHGVHEEKTYLETFYRIVTGKKSVNIEEKIGRLLDDKGTEKSKYKIDPTWSDEVKFAYIDLYALDNPGKPLSDIVKALFPEELREKINKSEDSLNINHAIFTAEANDDPILRRLLGDKIVWADRNVDDTPITFIQRRFGVWRDGVWDREGLTKADIRRTDIQLYNALAAWERRHPDDRLGLPTKAESNDAWVDRVKRGEEGLPEDRTGYLRFRGASSRRGSEK